MSKSKKAAKSVLIIVIFALASKLLAFAREALIAAKFGSSAQTDAFFIALTAISLFTTMITDSINNTMIPVLSEIEAWEGKEGKRNHTNNLLNIILLVSLVIVVLAWPLTPFIIKILASGFEGEQFRLTVLMTRIGLPAIFFAGIIGLLKGYLQSELMFTESAIDQFPSNFIYIFFLIFLSSFFGIKGLMVTSVLATISRVIIQMPGVKRTGFRYRPMLDFKDKYVKKMLYLIPPILISATVSDLNKIIDKSLASTLVDGSISALNYASKLDGITTSIFISAITTVMYPMLSQEANKDNYDGLKKAIINGINIILLITIPATVGTIVLAKPIVKVALQRGAFDSIATHMTVGALVFYSIGLSGTALKSLLIKVYYSLQDTKTPMHNSFIAVIINIVLNFALIKSMAHMGLALATSISVIVTALFLLYKLKNKIGPLGFSKSVKCAIKSLLAAVIMGIITYFSDSILAKFIGHGTLQELMALLASAGIGALVYFALIYTFKIEEVEWLIGLVKRRLARAS